MSAAEIRTVTEEPAAGEIPLWVHPEWDRRFPWLVQGVTGAGEGESFDLGLFGSNAVGEVLQRWRRLGEAVGMPATAHAHQIHGDRVRLHPDPVAEGLLILHGYDGHATAQPGLLLTASVADCVPVSVVDAERRAVAVVHAGWRGVAAGVLGNALETMARNFGSQPGGCWVHCGPSICGECYEVGPEVHAAVHPAREPPERPTPIDLRRALAEQATAWGVPPGQISRSGHCTRCGPGRFFSHRGGSPARQMGLIGLRPAR